MAANRRRRKVTITSDELFFDRIFEPERKKLQNKLGLSNLSQPNFTAILANVKAQFKFKLPKIDKKFLANVKK